MVPNLDDPTYKKDELCESLFVHMENKDYSKVRMFLNLLAGQGETIFYKNNVDKTVSPFEYAVDLQHEELIVLLLKYLRVGDRNRLVDGKNIMHYACEKNRALSICILIDNCFFAEVLDDQQRTPLHYCARFDARDAAKHLIKCKVEVDEKDVNNDTPLHVAFKHGHNEMVRIIGRCRRCNLNAKDKNGRTVLLLACMQNNLDLVKWLVANGAAVNSFDLLNVTPLIVAYFNVLNREMYEVLTGNVNVQYLRVRRLKSTDEQNQ